MDEQRSITDSILRQSQFSQMNAGRSSGGGDHPLNPRAPNFYTEIEEGSAEFVLCINIARDSLQY